MAKDNRPGKSTLSIKVRRDMADLQHVQRTAGLEKIYLQCNCPHVNEDGTVALFHTTSETSEFTHNPLFCCRICKKYIDISEITDAELNTALDCVDRAIDQIKIRLAPRENTPEADIKLYRKLVKTQKFLQTTFRDMIQACRNRKKNKKRSGSGGGSQWNYTAGGR